jgi:4-hydroxyacetophenone monooxygenase
MDLGDEVLPIGADDDVRAALELAEVPPLMATLAYITGDLSVLRDEFRPVPEMVLTPDYGIGPEATAEARAVAFDVLTRFRDDGGVPTPPPDEAGLQRILEFLVGGGGMEEYLELFRDELCVDGVDLRAPDWNKNDLAPDTDFTVAIVGAGMSGIAAAHRLQQAGVPFVILEKNSDIGGTWFENTYPGCRVDVPNHFYSYSFAQRADWPQYFSTQDVLLEYFQGCAERFGLRPYIRFETEVVEARWDDDQCVWQITVRTAGSNGAEGATETVSAQALVSAVGQLNRPKMPDIEGMDRFEGPSFHSAQWDDSVDLTGKRVAVIGTGASAMQLVPIVADQAGHLDVYQRTPAWLIPTPNYHDEVDAELLWLMRHVPSYFHWYRFWQFWRNSEGMLPLVVVDPEWWQTQSGSENETVGPMNEMLRMLLYAYLEEQFGDDPELLAAVTPHYPPAAKRVIRDNGIWAQTLKRDDVDLITTGIAEITPAGVRTTDGVEHVADVIVYGTGFQASKFLTPMKVVGRDGIDLYDEWGGDARAYLGITVPHFPNFFLFYGPNTNIVINGSIIYFSECEANYMLQSVRMLLERGQAAMDCRPDVHDDYNKRIDEGNLGMAWGVATVNTWYRNEFGRTAQNWPFSLLEYWKQTREIDPADYELLTPR